MRVSMDTNEENEKKTDLWISMEENKEKEKFDYFTLVSMDKNIENEK